jgi:sulfur-oxidizing protein SoxA
MQKKYAHFLCASLLSLSATSAFAQTTSDEIAKYREMIAEGNPSELYEMAGEELWRQPAGPKQVTLEKCDLGLGPGLVDGAFAQLPRYFKDTDRVQDLESRLMTCMQTLQGIAQDDVVNSAFGKGLRKDIEAVVAYVVTHSKDMKINVPATHPKEKEMVALGKKMFFFQGGPMDFSCASCHSASNQRIRLQDLPDLTTQAGAAFGWASWPAYRVSSGEFWTMQRRLNDCFRQQRMPFPIYGSDVTIALSIFMANKGDGGIVQTPGLKR